jgi:hypothetical protein
MGLLTGWLTLRTGGLEAAVALHVVTNVSALGLTAAVGELAVEQTATDAPWQVVAVDLPLLVGYTLLVAWLAGRRGLDRVTPTPATLPGPTAATVTPTPATLPGPTPTPTAPTPATAPGPTPVGPMPARCVGAAEPGGPGQAG